MNHSNDKLHEFLRSRRSWRSNIENLAICYSPKDLKILWASSVMSKQSRIRESGYDQQLWLIQARHERIKCDALTIKTIAAIKNWWSDNDGAIGNIAVLTDKALESRHFPLFFDHENIIFPHLELFRPTLEAAGLPSALADIEGSPLHMVFGVLFQEWFNRGRKPTPIELAVDAVNKEELPEFPAEINGKVVSEEWLESVFDSYLLPK